LRSTCGSVIPLSRAATVPLPKSRLPVTWLPSAYRRSRPSRALPGRAVSASALPTLFSTSTPAPRLLATQLQARRAPRVSCTPTSSSTSRRRSRRRRGCGHDPRSEASKSQREGGGETTLEEHGLLRPAAGLEEVEVLHVAGTDLEAVGVLLHERDRDVRHEAELTDAGDNALELASGRLLLHRDDHAISGRGRVSVARQ